MFVWLAEPIVDNLWPQVDWQDAVDYTNLSLSVIFITLAFAFLLYRFVLHHFWRIDSNASIRNLRRPWVTGLLIAFGVQFVLSLVLGLTMIPDKDPEVFAVVIAILLTAFFQGLIVVLLYWLLSWITSPMKVWLTPPGRRAILRVFGIVK